jgi:hypothetical protein
MTTIEQAIQEMFEQKVFTMEGIKAVQQLRENFSKLTDDYATKLAEIKKLLEINEKIITRNAELESKISEVRNRELAVDKREKEITRLEIEKTCADRMVTHTLGMFNTVFANATLKTSVLKEVINPSLYGNNGTTNTAMIKDKVTEDTTREID